jgi:hypothetical protein
MEITSNQPHPDIIDANRSADWAVRASEGNLYFIRSPSEISDLYLDGKIGNMGIHIT